MKTYQSFAKALLTLLGDAEAVRITSDGFMPLSIERIGNDADGRDMIALSHTGEQNGDLMRDPEIVFVLHQGPDGHYAEPISFRNDYAGTMQDVYVYDDNGRRTHVHAVRKAELKSFCTMWFRNLKQQGFLSTGANRERLA
ncbi:MAG: hypothetical protein OEY28_11795 [Nitrospira sp.]|nr:hypothetical protein [Nitrospira sp.]